MKNERIALEFRHAYRKCESCYGLHGYSEEKKNDFWQRMDEILLIYSSLFDISVNEAREELKLRDVNVGVGEQYE